jgi:hypothetical protein
MAAVMRSLAISHRKWAVSAGWVWLRRLSRGHRRHGPDSLLFYAAKSDVVPRFAYPCPDCRTTSNVHDAACDHDGRRREAVEGAYVDVLAALSSHPYPEAELSDEIGAWSPLHAAVLGRLKGDRRVEQRDDQLHLLTVEEYKEKVSRPTSDPLMTIYERGSVPGAHDNSVFALVAFYEMVGLSWREARDQVVEWMYESGTWARGGFEEASPEELVDNKKHVYDQGYGWKEKAKAAKAIIDRHS